MIKTLLEKAWLWFDLEGVEGEVVVLVANFGVVAVDCEAMAEISEVLKVKGIRGLG